MKDKILQYILQNYPVKANDLHKDFDLGRSMIHRYLLRLVNEGKIYKLGTPPNVYYFLTKENNITVDIDDDFEFLNVLPSGKFIYGLEGF